MHMACALLRFFFSISLTYILQDHFNGIWDNHEYLSGCDTTLKSMGELIIWIHLSDKQNKLSTEYCVHILWDILYMGPFSGQWLVVSFPCFQSTVNSPPGI